MRKPTNVAAFLKVCVDPRAAVSMMISFALGIYIGGVLDSALTLRLNQVRTSYQDSAYVLEFAADVFTLDTSCTIRRDTG